MKRHLSILLLIFLCCNPLFGTPSPRVNLVTMPKGGTHLLVKLFTQISEEIGVEPTDFFTCCHTMEVPDYKLSSPLKVVLVRDPRDAMVSSVEWVDWHVEQGIADHWFMVNWPEKTFKEKLHFLLFPVIPRFLNAFEYINILAFTRDPQNHVVRFEDLVGERGGGAKKTQKATIKGILSYIDIELPDEVIERILERIWGGSLTFRKGVIGRWKEHINDEDMQDWMNERLGDVMLELNYVENLNWL